MQLYAKGKDSKKLLLRQSSSYDQEETAPEVDNMRKRSFAKAHCCSYSGYGNKLFRN
jgi:hypothetical protein